MLNKPAASPEEFRVQSVHFIVHFKIQKQFIDIVSNIRNYILLNQPIYTVHLQ